MPEYREYGCIFDGHHGIYIYEMIQELAASQGWQGRIVRNSQDDSDALIEATDEAEEFLNALVADEDASFGWHDGEFFYQPNEWWEEASP